MAIKMSHYSTTDRYCCLALYEVQISQGLQYDISLKQFVGNVSAELSGASEAEKNILSPVLLKYTSTRGSLGTLGTRGSLSTLGSRGTLGTLGSRRLFGTLRWIRLRVRIINKSKSNLHDTTLIKPYICVSINISRYF